MQQITYQRIFFFHQVYGLVHIHTGIFPIRDGVLRQGVFQIIRNPDVIDDQAARLILEHPIDAGNGLHQIMARHRLVHIHRVHGRHIKAGQPHIAHNDDFQRVILVFHPFCQQFATSFVADVLLPVLRIGGRTGHDNFNNSVSIAITVPLRPQCDNRVVQVDGNSPGHRHHHGFAKGSCLPLFIVFDDILGNLLHAIFCADDRLQPGPLAFLLFFIGFFLIFRDLFKFFVNFRSFRFRQVELGNAAFVENFHGGPVLHGPCHIVDINIIAKNGGCVLIREFHRRAGESDK